MADTNRHQTAGIPLNVESLCKQQREILFSRIPSKLRSKMVQKPTELTIDYPSLMIECDLVEQIELARDTIDPALINSGSYDYYYLVNEELRDFLPFARTTKLN